MDKNCCDCKFFDGVCCMYECKCIAIFDTESSAEKCNYHCIGDYNQIELEKTNYR